MVGMDNGGLLKAKQRKLELTGYYNGIVLLLLLKN